MKNSPLIYLLALACFCHVSCGNDTTSPDLTPIHLEDPSLERCVRQALGTLEAPILPRDATVLSTLECNNLEIKSLDGLEYFTNLKDLALWENDIHDLTPLESLTALVYLQLGSNQIDSVLPLHKLTNLQRLGLYGNRIQTVSPLGGLTNLQWLSLAENQLTDVAILTQLGNLRWLGLEGNSLQNRTPLRSLRSAGCDVYDGSEVPSAKSTLSPIPQQPITPDISERQVTWVPTKGAHIEFGCIINGNQFKAHRDFGGNLTVRNRQIEYTLNGESVVVGIHDDTQRELCSGDYEGTCSLSLGVKQASTHEHADSPEQSPPPVCTVSINLHTTSPFFSTPKSYPDPTQDKLLLPLVLASPNQYDGGTCLFMSNTGAMEILLNQKTLGEQWTYEGDTDLSERFLMNASDLVPTSQLDYSITDVIETYNYHDGSLLNRDYPFTMGDTEDGLSAYVNWTNELPPEWKSKIIATPKADRTVLFIDPDLTSQSIWNVGLMNDDIVERIKYELRSKNSPVIVIYNHYLYWHASIVVGYDDNHSIGKCPMVDETLEYFKEQGHDTAAQRIETHLTREGGCSDKGVFFVRDSIYDGDLDEAIYDYGGIYEERYSQRIIERSYDWVKYLSNHAYTIHRQ